MYRKADPKPVIRRMAGELGLRPEALRNWIRRDEADHAEAGAGRAAEGERRSPAFVRDPQGRLGFFRRGARPDPATVLKLIDEGQDRFGAEPVPPGRLLPPDRGLAHLRAGGCRSRADRLGVRPPRSARRARKAGPPQ
ncbi:hypothetical protein [Streptomyces goshikiensis]|uniref:hypothetical protein n=1 Tax=Streptomyces goshikiensis TaxID=1942 RepID=UPI003690686C